MRYLLTAVLLFSAAVAQAENGDATFYLDRGIAWMKKGEADRAIVEFNKAIRLDPKNAMSYFGRGIARRNKGQIDKAIIDFNEAIRLDPKNAGAYGNRGIAWMSQNKVDKAIADFSEAIRLNPKIASPYEFRGNAWKNQGEYDKAIADYTLALRLNPQEALTHFNRGNTWEQKGEYAKAIVDYNEAIRLDPKNAFFHNHLAWNLATFPYAPHRNGEKAVKHATKACELSAWKHVSYITTLAAAHAEAGRFDEAVRRQQQAIDLAKKAERPGLIPALELYKKRKYYRQQAKE